MTPEEFLAKAREYGLTIRTSSTGLITLEKLFTPGSAGAYARVEGEVSLIYEVPQTQAGSTWGTDGASIGGAVALQNGKMVLNRSGCSKRFLAKLQKLMVESAGTRCRVCKGTGRYLTPGADGKQHTCDNCDGKGSVDPCTVPAQIERIVESVCRGKEQTPVAIMARAWAWGETSDWAGKIAVQIAEEHIKQVAARHKARLIEHPIQGSSPQDQLAWANIINEMEKNGGIVE